MTFLPTALLYRYAPYEYFFVQNSLSSINLTIHQFLHDSQFLGTFALWFGWYGFNPGSASLISSANRGEVAALAAVNTTLAACAGAVSAMFTSTAWEYVAKHKNMDTCTEWLN